MAKDLKGDMPHNLEAEQSLLGCILMDNTIQTDILAKLTADDFYAESHKAIFGAMKEIVSLNQPIDLVTLSDMLEKTGEMETSGGITYITELTDIVPSTANFKKYLDIVERDSMFRRLIKGSAEIISDCKTSMDKKRSLAFAEKTVYDIAREEDTGEVVKIGEVLPDVMNKLDELSNDKGSLRGLITQYKGLDNLLNGLHKSNLIVLAARPGIGKTSFAMNIVENVALAGASCAVFSLEMGRDELAQRMLCSVADVSNERASKGIMNKAEWLKIAKAKALLAEARIYIDDSAITTAQQMISKCRRIQRKNGLDLVVVDYIQLMSTEKRGKDANRQQEITEISRNLKILAKELCVPVIALSQLNRSTEKEKRRPQLADLRESGAIEQDADIVMFIHRPDKGADEKDLESGKIQKNVAEIIVEKNRSGPQGIVKLYFEGDRTKFVNLNEGGEPEGITENAAEQKAPVLTEENVPFPEEPKDDDDDIFG